MQRPSVSMWCHKSEKWYVVDMNGKYTAYDTDQEAEYYAFNCFLDYATVLENKIKELENQLGKDKNE